MNLIQSFWRKAVPLVPVLNLTTAQKAARDEVAAYPERVNQWLAE
ncbi:hypothetical protein [Ventosimonas gracilis]|nr:hypothetical protein [Ventosimonas gracilis]